MDIILPIGRASQLWICFFFSGNSFLQLQSPYIMYTYCTITVVVALEILKPNFLSFLETHSYNCSTLHYVYCIITIFVVLQLLKPIYRRLQTNCHRYEEYFHYCGNVSKFMSILSLSSFMTYVYKVCSLHHVILLSQSFRSVSLVLHQSLPGSKALR
jgi:hypothetical protein